MDSLESFLKENNLMMVEKISKGWTSFVYLVKDRKRKRFALKILREKSNRKQMPERESENLKIANSIGVGPQLVKTDLEKGIVLWEFVEGIPFSDWLFSNPKKKDLESFLEELFLQAEKLDSAGLSHGQLAGRGKNILVSNKKPVIIDFEKASTNRKCNNKNQLESFIYRSKDSSIVKKVKEILEKEK